MTQDNQHAAFEAFMREKNPNHDLQHEYGIYHSSTIQRLWDTWQASIEHDRQQRGEPASGAYISKPDLVYVLCELRDAGLYGAAQIVADALAAPQPAEPGLEVEK